MKEMSFGCCPKPCPPETLIRVLKDGLEQHDLIISKRILLDQTLRGAVDALAQSLSTAKPLFLDGHKESEDWQKEIGDKMQVSDTWMLDVALGIFSTCIYLHPRECK